MRRIGFFRCVVEGARHKSMIQLLGWSRSGMWVTAQLTGYISILGSLEWGHAGTIEINIVSLRIVRDGVSCSGWLTGQVCRAGRLPSEMTMVRGMPHWHLEVWLHRRRASMHVFIRPVCSLLTITSVIVLVVALSGQCGRRIVTFDHAWRAGVEGRFRIVH